LYSSSCLSSRYGFLFFSILLLFSYVLF
jgi:hypothetical protein